MSATNDSVRRAGAEESRRRVTREEWPCDPTTVSEPGRTAARLQRGARPSKEPSKEFVGRRRRSVPTSEASTPQQCAILHLPIEKRPVLEEVQEVDPDVDRASDICCTGASDVSTCIGSGDSNSEESDDLSSSIASKELAQHPVEARHQACVASKRGLWSPRGQEQAAVANKRGSWSPCREGQSVVAKRGSWSPRGQEQVSDDKYVKSPCSPAMSVFPVSPAMGMFPAQQRESTKNIAIQDIANHGLNADNLVKP